MTPESATLNTEPEEQLYGKQTELGASNFPSESRRLADIPALVRNFALVKAAAARANGQLGAIAPDVAEAIEKAATEIVEGRHDAQFPTALVLGGGGTTTNININEVIAARASQILGRPVHPNDHVNASQSTNDTYPTAMALAVHDLVAAPLRDVAEIIAAFTAKGEEYADTIRLGRTCLQDAVTLTVGETHRSHATALTRCLKQLREASAHLTEVPLGATVLGTGIGAVDGYREKAVTELSGLYGQPLTASDDLFDSLAHLDPYSAIAAAASRTAITMAKIAADLRLLSSGPLRGIADVVLPKVQAGSSIMPGKIIPVIPEYVMQLSYRIRGRAATVDMSVAAGELELNIMEPVIVDSLIDIFHDLSAAARAFREHCVEGLTWNGLHLENNTGAAFDRWIELASQEGYDAATAQVAKFIATQQHIHEGSETA